MNFYYTVYDKRPESHNSPDLWENDHFHNIGVPAAKFDNNFLFYLQRVPEKRESHSKTGKLILVPNLRHFMYSPY